MLNPELKHIRTALARGHISVEEFCLLGETAYKILRELRFSDMMYDDAVKDKAVIYWNGPGRTGLLHRWLNSGISDKKNLLIAACTGINPEAESVSWNKWVYQEMKSDKEGADSFRNLVMENRFIYDLSLILSCRDPQDSFFDETWQPVYRLYLEQNLETKYELTSPSYASKADFTLNTINEPVEDHLIIDFEDDEKISVNTLDTDDEEPLLPETHEMIMEGSGADLDLDELVIHEKPKSRDDKIIEEKSTWNRYLKPFLSENLIGVLGAGFLMLAWFTISVWVWNKGQYFRILAGALPMFATSLGLGWISRFFHKNLDRGVSPKAPLLFASLCILTLPFNYLISLSMVETGSFVGVSAGISMAVFYTVSIFFISKWTEDIFSFAPGNHLVEINSYILLPALLLFLVPGIRFIFSDMILFVTTFAFARMLYHQRDVTDLSFKFQFSLFGGNCLLIIFIFCVYIRQIPSLSGIALFIQISAMVISFFARSDKKINAVIISGALSFAGILIAVTAGTFMLPVCLLFSAVMWFYQREGVQKSWPNEIVAALILLLVPAIIHITESDWLLTGVFFLPSVFAACFYEYKVVKGELKILSYSLPVFILLLIFYLFMFDSISLPGVLTALSAALIYGIYGSWRYEVNYQRGLWLLTGILMIFFPAFCTFTLTGLKLSTAALGVALLLWASVSMKIKGPLIYQYRMSLYWVVSGALSVLFIVSYIEQPEFDIPFALGFCVVFVSLLIAAKKTTSRLPVYVLILCTGLFILTTLESLNISFKTGTGSAASSALLLSGIYLLDRFSVWEDLPANDRFFDRSFPLQSKKFLIYPLENTAWLLAVLGMFKALLNFTFIYGNGGFVTDGIKVCLSFLLLFFICLRFIKRYSLKYSGYLILIPGLAFYINICSFLPLSLLPVFILLSLFLLLFLIRKIELAADYDPEILNALNSFMRVMSFGVLPLGFFIYIYYYLLPGGISGYQTELVLSVILMSFFIHITSVKNINTKLVHVVLGHISLLIALGFLLLEKDYLQQVIHLVETGSSISQAFALNSLHFILILSAVFCVPGYLLEVGEGRLRKAYSKAFHVWLLFTSVVYALLVIHILSINYRGVSVSYFAAGIILVHMSNRFFFLFPCIVLKGFFSLGTGLLLFKNPLSGIFAGLIIFSVAEYLFYLTEKFPQFRIQSVKEHHKNSLRRTAWLVHGFSFIFLFMHMVYFIFQPEKIPDYLLYMMIPFGVFVYRYLGFAYTGYIAVGLFAYANCFIALNYSTFFRIHGLNDFHLISIALIFSLLLFRGYDSMKNRFRRTV